MIIFHGKEVFKCKHCGHTFEAFDTEGGIKAGPNLPPCPKCDSTNTRKINIVERLFKHQMHMSYKKDLDIIYKDVCLLAVSHYRNHQTISLDEAIEWINKRHPELPSRYKGFNGVLQAAYDRAQDNESREAIRTVFVNNNGKNAWL